MDLEISGCEKTRGEKSDFLIQKVPVLKVRVHHLNPVLPEMMRFLKSPIEGAEVGRLSGTKNPAISSS